MATDKRQRQKQGRQERLEAERVAVARSRRNRGIRNAVIFAVVVVIVAFVLSKTSSKDKGDSVKSDAGTSTTKVPSKPGKASVCPPTDGTAKRTLSFSGTLKQCLEPGRAYRAVVTTSKGAVEIALDTKRTPKTTNAFVTLSRWKYYDGTKLFRTEKATGIIQGGSPHTQSNADTGPGFVIADEGGTFTSADYGPGALAMARSASANSANGQFFLLSSAGGRYLGDKSKLGSAGSYVVFGRVSRGLDVLKQISALDDGSGKPPSAKVPVITRVEIKQS